MHPEARNGLIWAIQESSLVTSNKRVLDLGGQEINGNCHDLFTDCTITTLDLENADIIADVTTWEPVEKWDVVMSTELLEHVADWPAAISVVREALSDDGVFVMTCASTGRPRHGATGAGSPAEGEHYGNVSPDVLIAELARNFSEFAIKYQSNPGDVYAWARGIIFSS